MTGSQHRDNVAIAGRGALRSLFVGLMMASGLTNQAAGQGPYFQGDRILIDARINQQPVRLAYDTGATFSALSGPAKNRLELKSVLSRTLRVGGRDVLIEKSEPINVRMFGEEQTTALPIIPSFQTTEVDGVMSWNDLKVPRILIDGVERRISSPDQPAPEDWQVWPIEAGSAQLFFDVTREGQSIGRVLVDTGAHVGLRLSPELWKKWKESHPEAGLTLEPFGYALGLPELYEMAWTDQYELGDLVFYQCDLGPIPEQTGETVMAEDGKPMIAMIGLRALRHLKLLIDREAGTVSMLSVSPRPSHNRAGAHFRPDAASQLIAQVLEGSPAAQAGLRNGDRLSKVHGEALAGDVTAQWKTVSQKLSQREGTVVQLEVIRDGQTLPVSITLKEILR